MSDQQGPKQEHKPQGQQTPQRSGKQQSVQEQTTTKRNPSGLTLLFVALGVLAMVGAAYWLRPLPAPEPVATQPTQIEELRELPTAEVTLKVGEGQALVQSYCTMCHSLVPIVHHTGFSKDTWESEVHKMRHKYGAPIDDETAKIIVRYLQDNYSSDMPEALGTAADMSPGTVIKD